MRRVAWFLTAVLVATVAAAQEPTHLDKADAGPSQPSRQFLQGGILWDNGDTDGVSGYSNADVGVFGFQRELLDDFVVPAGETWNVTGMIWLHIWDTLPPGSGTGAALEIVQDSAGTPNGPVVGTANVTSYSEIATGRVWFGRQEAESTAGFDPIVLTEGTYWIEFNIIGPEPNFGMVRSTVTGNELWIDYDDFPPRQPGSALFGVPRDMAFALTGTIGGVPTMPNWAMIALLVVLLAIPAFLLRRRQNA